jgi:hypothetical protein
MPNMTKDDIDNGFSALFLPWIGMEDFSDIDHQPYELANLEDEQWLRSELNKTFVPYLSSLDENRRNDALQFALFARQNALSWSLQDIFASMLIGLRAPKDVFHFFNIILEECFPAQISDIRKASAHNEE